MVKCRNWSYIEHLKYASGEIRQRKIDTTATPRNLSQIIHMISVISAEVCTKKIWI